MGTVDVPTNLLVNGDINHDGLTGGTARGDSVARLHDIVHKLEEENEFLLPLRRNDSNESANDNNNGGLNNGFVGNQEEETEENEGIDFSLENTPPIDDKEFDEVEYEKDDSWLYSPTKEIQLPGTPAKNPDSWLKEDAVTPDLLRVRSCLSEKLEVIAIESRKGRLDKLRKTKDDFRKGSTLSLDWDFEANPNNYGTYSKKQRTVNALAAWAENAHPQHHPPQQEEMKSFSLDWSDEDGDSEDELSPMHINLNQPLCQPRGTKPPGNLTFKRGSHGPQGQNVAAVRPRTANNEPSEFSAKPSGGVKPRGRGPPPQQQMDIDMEDFEGSDSSPSPGFDYEDSGPVVPRGGMKKELHTRSLSPSGYDDPVSAPVILRGTAKRNGQSAVAALRSFSQEDEDDLMVDLSATYDASTFRRSSNLYNNSVSPRSQGNIGKPVQRRKPLESSESDLQVRPRGAVRPRSAAVRPMPNNNENVGTSDTGGSESPESDLQVRPRGAVRPRSAAVRPMPNNSENDSPSLKVNLPPSGDGAVVRRRGGPVQTAEVAPMPRRSVDQAPRPRAADPSPRRKDPLTTVRQQEVQPMRRSAGGGGGGGAQPRSNNDNMARPRRSFSPQSQARPRGSSPARPRGAPS